jgi:hypothetical protein
MVYPAFSAEAWTRFPISPAAGIKITNPITAITIK